MICAFIALFYIVDMLNVTLGFKVKKILCFS